MYMMRICTEVLVTCRLLVLLIYGYGIIAFSFCLMDEVVPIYASTPRLHNGLGMNGRQLSIPLSVGGGVLMFVSIFLYPVVQRKIGCHRCGTPQYSKTAACRSTKLLNNAEK